MFRSVCGNCSREILRFHRNIVSSFALRCVLEIASFQRAMETNDSNMFPPNPESISTATPRSGSSGELPDNIPLLQDNNNNNDPIPSDLLFNDSNLLSVIVYAILCVISAVGNTTVFGTLWRFRRLQSRSSSTVNLFVMHLSVADLIVTFVMMPLEIGWNMTVAWKAGDVACRLLMFFRAFGFYLSSFVLVAISLDRCFAVARPLYLHTTSSSRGRAMLIGAWVLSAVASAPQVRGSVTSRSTCLLTYILSRLLVELCSHSQWYVQFHARNPYQ